MRMFITASGTGQNWRDVVQHLLKDIMAQIEQSDVRPNLAYLYITDKLARDAQSIVEILRSVSGVQHWVGVTGAAVFSEHAVHYDKPAASCALLKVDDNAFAHLTLSEGNYQVDLEKFIDAYRESEAYIGHFYFHPELGYRPDLIVGDLYEQTLGFMTGGVSAARGTHCVLSENSYDCLVSGYGFSEDVPIVSALFEGFENIGREHQITDCRKNVIYALDGRMATSVLSDDMAEWLESALSNDSAGAKPTLAEHSLDDLMAYLPAQGVEMQLAFRYYQNDMAKRKIKHITAQNESEGTIASTYRAAEGGHVSFVFRNPAALKKDLARSLMDLRVRLNAEGQLDALKGGIYISNFSRFDKEAADIELVLIREILGDIPIAGFYAAGEVSHNSLYNFTGVLTLFL